jgi:hypothetical protein
MLHAVQASAVVRMWSLLFPCAVNWTCQYLAARSKQLTPIALILTLYTTMQDYRFLQAILLSLSAIAETPRLPAVMQT